MKFPKKSLVVLLLFIAIAVISFYILQAHTKEGQKVYRVGVLCGLPVLEGVFYSFKDEMAKLGYIDGKNIIYEFYVTNFEPEREEQILRKFVEENVDLIFTFPTEVTMMAKKISSGSGIPILFSFCTIEGSELVESVYKPGGTLTGVREPGPYIYAKRLEILHQMVPHATRIYITYSKAAPFVDEVVQMLREAAERINISLIEDEVSSVEEIRANLESLSKTGKKDIHAILLIGDPIVSSDEAMEILTNFSLSNNIPAGGIGGYTFGDRVIFSYEITIEDMGRLAAPTAVKLLNGEPPSTIPVITPEPTLIINYKLSQKFGLNVSEELLALADKIIR